MTITNFQILRNMFLRPFSCIIAVVIVLTVSCKKEEIQNPATGNGNVNWFPREPADSRINTLQLNGGNIVGTWAMDVEELFDYINDTLSSYSNDVYYPGEGYLVFLGNGTMYTIYMGDSVQFTYTTSLNNLTMTDASGSDVLKYGVSGNNLRLDFTNQLISNGDEYLFVQKYLLHRD